MKPNIFEYRAYIAEDFFSLSLAYIATTFPNIGQNLIQRIAVLAGKPPMFFGSFVSCSFVGHRAPKPHFASKPDLAITCSKRTIYFENKLETPMSFDQMRRHADPMGPNDNLIFVSNIRHQNAALRSLSGYLHPTDADHYVWVDLLPAFESHFRKKSLAANILEDFKTALKANGMIGRTIKDAKGSLFTRHSEAEDLALRQLGDVMTELGYKVRKKSVREDTLRVYPYGQYPLLNPRFRATEADLDENWDKECLELTVWSKGKSNALRRYLDYLENFRSTKDCAFLGLEEPSFSRDHHQLCGWFVMPLRFLGRDPNVKIDFTGLTESLRRTLIFLRKAPHFPRPRLAPLGLEPVLPNVAKGAGRNRSNQSPARERVPLR
jgi:hypothetical protein